jgi:hypothetical protein
LGLLETLKTNSHSLEAEIGKKDKEIYLMGYELFWLSEEEIKIVEGKEQKFKRLQNVYQ